MIFQTDFFLKCVCSSSVIILSNDCGNRFSYESVGRVWRHCISSVVCISFLCVSVCENDG